MQTRTLATALTAALLLTLVALAVHATPTTVTIRVLAHDAKLIGDLAGGAHVTLRDAETGRILAEGMHRGGTGDTERIIKKPHVRGTALYDTDGAASFVAELDLDEPTWLTAEVKAPLNPAHVRTRASLTFLVLPGHDIKGDGVVVELYGLIVNILTPHAETPLEGGQTIEVEAGVKLLCTCPLEPGGLWDSNHYAVRADLLRKGEVIDSIDLTYAGRANVFAGSITLPKVEKRTAIELRVVAANDDRRNYGMHSTVFRVHGPPK